MRKGTVATRMRRSRTETRKNLDTIMYTDAGNGISQPLGVTVKHWCHRTMSQTHSNES
jgi:hypothetical protein